MIEEKLSSLNLNEHIERIEIKNINSELENKMIKTTGFIDTIRSFSKYSFLILRDRTETLQCIINVADLKDKFDTKSLSVESFIEIEGKVVKPKNLVKSCTKTDIEIKIANIKILGDVYDRLPFNPKDVVIANNNNSSSVTDSNVGYSLRLDNRFLDFRVPSTYATIKIIDGVMNGFRTFLRENDFIELKTTKIIQSGSEGGANLFKMKYFDKTAYLAQSAQLYKQMAIVGGCKKIYEIGHAYRAEVSNVNRYLSEFTVVDMEFEFESDNGYEKAIHFIYSAIVSVLNHLNKNLKKELEIMKSYSNFEDLVYTEKPLIIAHCDAIDLIKEFDSNINITHEDDLSREHEKTLGKIVKNKYGVNLFVVKDYPKSQRPFYTYFDKKLGKTRSYDFIMRGEEILSGAQRVTNYDDLKEAIVEKGVSIDSLTSYLKPFKFGAPPHGGCGIGLERFIKSFVGSSDIRHFSLFPRDPNRLYP